MTEKEIPAGVDLTKLPTIGLYKQNTELTEAFKKAMEESPHVLVIQEKPRWIPCSERLPDSYYGEVKVMSTAESMNDAITFDAGYTEGKRDGYAEGFHDCLVCLIKSSTGSLQWLMDKEREYNSLVERYRKEKSRCEE